MGSETPCPVTEFTVTQWVDVADAWTEGGATARPASTPGYARLHLDIVGLEPVFRGAMATASSHLREVRKDLEAAAEKILEVEDDRRKTASAVKPVTAIIISQCVGFAKIRAKRRAGVLCEVLYEAERRSLRARLKAEKGILRSLKGQLATFDKHLEVLNTRKNQCAEIHRETTENIREFARADAAVRKGAANLEAVAIEIAAAGPKSGAVGRLYGLVRRVDAVLANPPGPLPHACLSAEANLLAAAIELGKAAGTLLVRALKKMTRASPLDIDTALKFMRVHRARVRGNGRLERETYIFRAGGRNGWRRVPAFDP